MSEPPPQLLWGHININVRNLDQSIEFYKKLGFAEFLPAIPYLGLTASPDASALPESSAHALGLAPDTRGRACIMQLGNTFPKIDLTELAHRDQRMPLSNAEEGLVRLCLASRDLAADYAHLSAQGVSFLSAPQPSVNDLADVAVCKDPDGTLIELIQLHLKNWPTQPATR